MLSSLLLFATATLSATAASLPASEVAALRDFYTATGGPKFWANRDGWSNPSSDPCTWFGVTCVNNHVDGLFLSRNNLTGTIPDSIADFTLMTGLDFGVNHLTGPLPASFGTLTQLYAVSFRENELSGPLPFSKLTKMQFAHLDFNHFTGSLDVFANCPELKVLGLTDNSMSGTIPQAFSKLVQMQTLFLGGNKLEGSVPPLPLPQLTCADLSRNQLTGELPARSLFSVDGLVEFLTFGNHFSGEPAPLFSQHPTLVVLDTHSNELSGDLPAVLARGCPCLDVLRLQQNKFTGFVPVDFAQTTVTSVDLSGNPLFCPVPQWSPKAECSWWKLSRVQPSTSTLSGGATAVITGTSFVQGTKGVSCSFGSAGTTPATVSDSGTVRCAIPRASKAGTVELSLTYAGTAISSGSLQFRYISGRHRSPVPARKGNAYPAVKVVIAGEAKCPDMASIESVMLPVLRDLGEDVLDLTIAWIARKNPQYPMGYWTLHGQTEIIGNAITSCARAHFGLETALELAECMNANITRIPSNAAECSRELKLDWPMLHQCALGDEGAALVEEAVQVSDKFGAVWSPTIWIEGELFCLWHSSPCKATKETDFGRAICEAYTGPKPAACAKYQ